MLSWAVRAWSGIPHFLRWCWLLRGVSWRETWAGSCCGLHIPVGRGHHDVQKLFTRWTAVCTPINLALRGFPTRADSKLQWRIVIPIFSLLSVHTRETTSPSLQCSIPERGEEAWLISVFVWHADCYFIWDRISIRKCAVYRQTWLEGHVAPAPFGNFAVWFERLRHWKTPPDHHLNCTVQIR